VRLSHLSALAEGGPPPLRFADAVDVALAGGLPLADWGLSPEDIALALARLRTAANQAPRRPVNTIQRPR
jgi:hypothetical protein